MGIGWWNAPACLAASVKGRRRKRPLSISRRPFRDTSPRSRRTDCPSLRSGLKRWWWLYDQAAQRLWARLRPGAWQGGVLSQAQHGSHTILRRDAPFAQIVVPD